MIVDDMKIMAHVLNIIMLVTSIKLTARKKIFCGDLRTPRKGSVMASSERTIRFNKDSSMNYLLYQPKPNDKTHTHPSMLFQLKKVIMIYHWRVHYDSIRDPNSERGYID